MGFFRTADPVAAAARRVSRDDERRGRPDVDLRAWAEARGLSFRDGASQAGFFSVTCPWSVDLLFNVVRGATPGGDSSVLCHQVRLYAAGESGAGNHSRVEGGGESAGRLALGLIGLPVQSGPGYYKVPYTAAGVRAPHLATITGLHVVRRELLHADIDRFMGSWRKRPLDDLGRAGGGWVAMVRARSDEDVVERLLTGPVRQLLEQGQGDGFDLAIEYGQVAVSRQGFVTDDAGLDALMATADWLGQSVRSISAMARGDRPWAEPLPAPEWLAAVRQAPGDAHTLWPIGARLEQVVAIATERGLAVEDPRSFHEAYPAINVPGEAFGVLAGRLPNTDLYGRLLCSVDRPMHLPDDFRSFLTDPGGPAGCDVAVVEVGERLAPTTRDGTVAEGLRYAVDAGMLTAWRVRPRWQADGPSLDRLAADVATIVGRGTR